MKKIIILFSLVFLVKICYMQDCKAQKEKISSDLKQILQKPFSKDTWWLYKAYQQFADAKEQNSLDICQKLKQVEINKLSNMDKFYFYQLNFEANCEIKLDETELESSKLEDFYKAFILTAKYQKQKKLSDYCLKITEFFDQTGSGLADKAKTDATYQRSYLIYEMASICYESKDFKPTEQFNKQMSTAIKGFVINSMKLSMTMIGMFEKSQDSYRTTVGNVLYIYKINKFIKNQEFIDEFNNYVNFILEGKTIYLKPQEKAFAFQLTNNYQKLLHSYPKIELEKNSFELNDKKTIQMKGQIKNYFKSETLNLSKIEIKAQLYYKTQEKVKLKVTMEQDSFAIEVPTKDLEIGMYQIKFEIITKEQSFKVFNKVTNFLIQDEFDIKFTTKAQISNLQLDTGYQNQMPDHLGHKVKFNEKLSEILKTDQNGFIYLQFSISSISQIKPQQVSAKLINPSYIKSTNQVIAKFNEQSQSYSLIIDIGDPDHIQAYKGKHDLQIIVADPLISSNIQWKVATFDIDFKREITTRPVEDTDYNLKPEIQHYFSEPLPDPPKFITMGFIALLAIVIGIFLSGVCQLSLNSSKLFNGVSVVLFILCIFAYIGVLGLFWVKINIFQTLLLFLILLIPTLITGNFALLAINQKGKEKID